MDNTEVLLADYKNKKHASDIITLLDLYASEPVGGGQPLDGWVKDNLISQLFIVPGAFSILAYRGETAIGLTNCIQGFSTFACRPLINIHDVYVSPDARGLRLSHQMFEKVEEIAKQRDCCKLTLEVLAGNENAQKAYIHSGFIPYELDPESGKAEFWQKKLN